MEPVPSKPKLKIGWVPLIFVVLLSAGSCYGIIWSVSHQVKKDEDAQAVLHAKRVATAEAKRDAEFKAMTVVQHLEAAVSAAGTPDSAKHLAAAPDGPAKSKALVDMKKKQEEVARQAKAKAEADKKRDAMASAIARKLMAERLETDYLDKGMDIRVRVSGKNNEILTMKYVLFNRVWAHKFAQGDSLEVLRNAGFKRVSLEDGYNFGWKWDL